MIQSGDYTGPVHRELFGDSPIVATADFDEAQLAVTRVYLPHRLHLLDCDGTLDMRFNAVRMAGVTAGYLRYGRDVRVQTVDTTHLHVDIQLSGHAEYRCGRMDVVRASPGQAAVFTPGLPADIRWQADSAQLCLMIDRADLDRELASMLGRPVTAPVEFSPGMSLTGDPGRTWRKVLDLLVREAELPDSPLRHPVAARNLQNMLINSLLLLQPNNYLDALLAPAPMAGPRAVRAAIELLECHPERLWTPGELARQVSVSVRSLHEGFRRTVTASPMAYLRQLRLRKAREDLVLASADTLTVTEIAGRWGFAHLGRFAAAYRREYSESPSTTLRRQP
jgi:AraC-like DNA-binding protein